MKKYVLMLTVFVALLLLSACKVFHSHSWMAATCTNPSTCSSCGETEGSAKGHSWKAATCTAPKTCKTCGETEGSAKGHSWKAATCTAPKTCKTCGETEGSANGHSWKDATCTTPKTCKTCGETEGSAKGHSWKAATCTAPKTCKTCGETEGNAKGHSWKAATCTAPKTCGICHATTGTVSAHVDNGKGKCTKCGKDLFWDAVKAGLDIKLVIPSVGTTNKYFTVVYVNETGYDAYLSAFTYANGKGGYRKEADNFLLKNGMMIDVAYYEGMNLLYSSKSIYLDNNSQANTQLKINGKDVFVKFNVNGIVAIGASEREIGVY